jgi:hypothetical protein
MLLLQPSRFKRVRIKLVAVVVPKLPFEVNQVAVKQRIKISWPLSTAVHNVNQQILSWTPRPVNIGQVMDNLQLACPKLIYGAIDIAISAAAPSVMKPNSTHTFH